MALLDSVYDDMMETALERKEAVTKARQELQASVTVLRQFAKGGYLTENQRAEFLAAFPARGRKAAGDTEDEPELVEA